MYVHCLVCSEGLDRLCTNRLPGGEEHSIIEIAYIYTAFLLLCAVPSCFGRLVLYYHAVFYNFIPKGSVNKL